MIGNIVVTEIRRSLDYICTSLMNIIHREKVTSDVTACCQIIVLLEVIFGLGRFHDGS